MQFSRTGKALRGQQCTDFSLLHFIFSKMQATAVMRREHRGPLQGQGTDSAWSTLAKLDVSAVILLEVRTETNSYSLSKESMFELSKNASNSRPTEQNYTRTIRDAEHNNWGFQQSQARAEGCFMVRYAWKWEQCGGYGEKENVTKSSQALVNYLPHDTASKRISSAHHY